LELAKPWGETPPRRRVIARNWSQSPRSAVSPSPRCRDLRK
jgi:hypothetical protein